jgi:hypothetical protein
VFLSQQQAFGTTPTACIRFAMLSRIETLHILLEHFYDSQRNENAAQLADFIGGSPSREAMICSVRSGSSSSGLPSLDRLHTSSRRIRAASWRCLAAAIVTRSTRGTGRKPYPWCLGGGSGKTVQLWDWPPTIQIGSPSTSRLPRASGGRPWTAHSHHWASGWHRRPPQAHPAHRQSHARRRPCRSAGELMPPERICRSYRAAPMSR